MTAFPNGKMHADLLQDVPDSAYYADLLTGARRCGNVTSCTTIEGFRPETTAVLHDYLSMTCFNAGDVLPVLFTSPAYIAVME